MLSTPIARLAQVNSLPPLSGWGYRLYCVAWWVMAAAAISMVVWSLLEPQATPGITIARTAKAIVLITVSTILFRRRRQDAVAGMLALSFLFWTVSSGFDLVTSSALPAILDQIRFFLFASALLVFPDGDFRPRWTRHIAVAIALTFLLGLGESLGLLATSLFLPVAIGCVLAALAALSVRYRLLDAGIQKQQLKWVVLGLVYGIGLILIARAGKSLANSMYFPDLGLVLLEGIFQIGIVCVAIGFLMSLLRYRLYDAEAVISRSAVSASLTLLLLGIFAGSEVLIELVGQSLFGMSFGDVSGPIAAAVAAMMLTPLHERIGKWAENWFQRDLVILKSELPEQLALLSAGASLDQVSSAVLPRIEQAVQASRIVFVVGGKITGVHGVQLQEARELLRRWKPHSGIEAVSRCDDGAFTLQLTLRCPSGRPEAWLLLGPRPDGSFYSRDDLDALTEIIPPLQRTIWAVVERQDAERQRRLMEREFRDAIKQFEERLASMEMQIGQNELR